MRTGTEGQTPERRLAQLTRLQSAAALARGRDVARASGRQLGAHSLTGITLAIAVVLVCSIPQISALLSLQLHSGPALGLGLVLWVARLLVILGYTLLWVAVVPAEERVSQLGSLTPPARWLKRIDIWVEDVIGRPLDALVQYVRGNLGWAIGLIAVGAGTVCWPLLQDARWDPPPVAFHLVLAGVWLLPMARGAMLRGLLLFQPTAHDASSATRERSFDLALRAIGRGITLVLLTNVAGEFLWWTQRLLDYGLAYRLYSTWAIVQIFFAVFVAVRTIDVLARLELRWLRTSVVAALGLVLMGLPGGETVGGRTQLLASAAAASSSAQPARPDDWFDALSARLAEIPAERPVLLVAASGGGSRAAIFSSLVFETLRSLPASSDFARAAPTSKPRTLADDVLMISSVSGGSLATAYFIAPPTRNAAPTTSLRSFAESLDTYLDAPAPGAFDPLSSVFVADMTTDYMAPLLRGVLNMLQERGSSVSNFWGELYGWHRVRDTGRRPAGRPLALFNATSVQSGLRITVGFPPLPGSILAPGVTLSDVDPGISVSLAEAVRVSANFPYGFDYAVLDLDPKRLSAAAAQDQQLIDGGVVDNTGLDTLAMLLGRLVALADDPRSERERALQPRAAAVLGELRRHGVLLLEIDAGARPSRPSWLAERLPSLSKPLQAMTQAAHLNASIVRERNIERIRQALVDGDAAAVPSLVGVVRAGFDCRPKGDVMTAWALDIDDEAEILQGFMQIEARLTRSLQTQLAAIAEVHATRRAALDHVDHATTAAESDAKKVRVLFGEYLKQWLDADAKQRAGSLQCSKHGARPSDWDAFYDTALRCALGDVGACGRAQVAALHPPVSASSATSALQEPRPVDPAPRPAKPDPHSAYMGLEAESLTRGEEASTARDRGGAVLGAERAQQTMEPAWLGWIYLGEYDGASWATRYGRWQGNALPRRGDTLQVVGRSNVRIGLPDAVGELKRVRMTLAPGTTVEIVELEAWEDTGLIWARVRPAIQDARTPAAAD